MWTFNTILVHGCYRGHILELNITTHTNTKAKTPQIPTLENQYILNLMFFTLWNLIKKIQTTFENFWKINEYNQCYALKPNPSGCASAGAANVARGRRSSVGPQPLEGRPAAGQPCGLESRLTDPGSSCRDSPPAPPKEERILRPGDLCQPCGHPHPGLMGVRAPPLHPLQHENFIANLFGLDFDRGLAKRPFLSFFPSYSINTFSLKKSGAIW